MKSRTFLIVILVAALLMSVAYGSFWLGQNRRVIAPPSAMQTPKKPLYWYDPMSPAQRFDKPGKSPFMDMDLVPVYEDSNDNGGNNADGKSVHIDARIQQNMGIRTALVIQGKLESNLTAVGSVAYNDRDEFVVQARSNGYVEHLYVRAVLDPVKKGQKLADLYVPDWVAAQEEYLTVMQIKGAHLDGMLEGAKQRMRLVGMSDEQINQVTKAGKAQPRSAVNAPANGVVSELALREGMTVVAGAPMFRVNGISRVWVNAEVAESAAGQIRVGDLVEAQTLSGVSCKGRVNALLGVVNPTTRTFKVRIELANPKSEWMPGMFATLHFLSNHTSQSALLVPTEAVIQTGARSVVMLVQSPGKFKAVDIVTGSEVNGQTEVKSGLEAGQQVVVSGQFLIDSEASLKGVALRMNDNPDAIKSGTAQ